jgi:hypothetical protein
MSISDDEIRKTFQELLSDKSTLLVLSQLLDSNFDKERMKLRIPKRDCILNLAIS